MKNILLVNASNRKKNTYKLLSSIEAILKDNGFKTELITLSDYKIDFCKGCECCVLKGGCFIKDDCNKIIEKFKSCDGLIIGTPVYLNNMTGILKAFIDRTCSWFHRTEVSQKPTLLLANTQGSGLKSTLNSIEESLIQWGVCLCGTISRNGRSFKDPIKEKELSKFIKLVKSNGEGYVPSFKEVYTYNIQRTLAKNVFPIDKTYWEKKDWINNPYFSGAKVSIIKKVYGNGIYKLLCNFIKPIE